MRHRLCIVSIISFLLCHVPLYAQDTVERTVVHPSAWITLGLGGGYFGPTFCLKASYASNNNLFSIRYLKGDEFRFNVEGQYDQPALAFKELSFLYGRSYTQHALLLSISAGIGYVAGTDRGSLIQYRDYQRVDISDVGLPFEAAFRFNLGFVGLGGSWYGNLNSKRSFSGAMVQLSIGIF